MWPLLLCTTLAVFFYDYFYVIKTSSEPQTDYERTKKLYTSLRSAHKQPNETKIQMVIGIIKSGIDTIKVICKLKKEKLLNYIFAATRLDNKYITTWYFYRNKWYKSIIYHPSHVKSSQKITKVITGSLEITDKILLYAGPYNDFYNQEITAKTFGLDNMIITMDTPSGKIEKIYN